MRPEGLSQWEIPITALGIEPAIYEEDRKRNTGKDNKIDHFVNAEDMYA
jgi:hypothetical protein